jgi:hypothetical protein
LEATAPDIAELGSGVTLRADPLELGESYCSEGTSAESFRNPQMAYDYQYDVAFSFLTVDESIAFQLHIKLKSRLSSFFYADAERQRLIAGRDGDAVYTDVFGKQTRTVVVLYRAEWGRSGFTQIESTAIRNRAFDQGYEFTTFINRDGSPLPGWLPKTRVWIGLDRLSIDATAAVIESRVQEAGGEPHDETAIGRIERMRAERIVEGERRLFLDSERGASGALDGCQSILNHIQMISRRSYNQIEEPRQVRSRSFTFEIRAAHYPWTITVAWTPWANNTTKNAELVVKEWHGTPDVQPFSKGTSFLLDYQNGIAGWKDKRDDGRFYSHEDVADWIARRLLSRIEEDRRERRD